MLIYYLTKVCTGIMAKTDGTLGQKMYREKRRVTMYQPEQPVFDQAIESNIEITYGIEDVPKPWWKSLYFASRLLW